ncbi:MAG TPA: SDR family NAD(P)-dependent oxidoreductase [Anaerolineales bacterium]|nr:SDR family NAD(P)-dependent oxidoreductase [Anaerolineales bacterium]
MTDQTILITGASRGLGAAAAKIAAKMGANVVINARSEASLYRMADEIRKSGGEVLSVPGDVSKIEDCHRLVDQTLVEFGQLDALINNAGIIKPIEPIAEGSAEDWRRNLEINLLGPILLTQIALPHLRMRNGRVISTSSGAAVRVIQGWGAYCTARAGLNHFNRVLASEESGITAITFRPGVMDTEMQSTIRREGDAGMPEETYARYLRLHQEGELLSPKLPGRALTALALYAPHQWSGEFIAWDEDRVQALVKQYGMG